LYEAIGASYSVSDQATWPHVLGHPVFPNEKLCAKRKTRNSMPRMQWQRVFVINEFTIFLQILLTNIYFKFGEDQKLLIAHSYHLRNSFRLLIILSKTNLSLKYGDD